MDEANGTKNLRGHLLVASPKLVDPNFRKAVVLMVQHTEDGALGVILNRPSNVTIKQVWEQLGEPPCESDQVLHLGGPVEGPLMAVHMHRAFSQIEILPGLYFSVAADEVKELVAQKDDPVWFFVGHAGWGAGQLENELAEGAWLTLPATLEHVVQGDEGLWETVTKEIVRSTLFDIYKPKHVPKDPSLN